MTVFFKRILALVVMSLVWATGFGTPQAPPRVSLLTVSPGPEIYELDGHTGLRFVSPGLYDYVVNWGVFDFNSPGFLYRFVKGETDYMAYPFPTGDFLAEYDRQGREVTEQVLDLTPEQTMRLEAAVAENLLPQNRTYRYNYIYDNCATRPLSLIEGVTSSPLEIAPFEGFVYGETGVTDTPGRHTFRKEMTRSHADYPWYQFGIDLALGCGLDIDISDRQRTYSPLYLKEALRHTYITDDDGTKHPLVKSTSVILPAKGRVTAQATPFLLTPFSFSVAIFLLTCVVVIRDIRRGKVSRWYDTVFYGVLFVVSLLLTFLIFVSVHEATSPNWLYLWINPLTAIPMSLIWLKSCKRVVYCYQICNFVALFLLLSIGVFAIQGLNSAFYLLIAADMTLSARYIHLFKR